MADCAQCGTPLGGHAQVCDVCGLPTDNTPLNLDQFFGDPDSDDRGPRGLIPVILVAVVIIVAVVGATIAMSRDPSRRVQRADDNVLPTSQPSVALITDNPSGSTPLDTSAVPSRTPSRSSSTSAAKTSAHPSSSAARSSTAPAHTTAAASTSHAAPRSSTHPPSSPPPTHATSTHTPPPGRASVARGSRYRGAGCSSRCYYVQVQLSGFAAGSHHVQCVAAQSGAVFGSFDSGNGTNSASCWYAHHRSVYVVVDSSIRSNTVTL